MKGQYKKMVASDGKEEVDRRLMISQIQARRRAVARGGGESGLGALDDAEFYRLEGRRDRPRPEGRPPPRIDDTMLY